MFHRAVAYAKINLSLEVLGRRSDGFHDLASVMQTVALGDELYFRPNDGFLFTCSDPDLETHSNLVVRAANILAQRFPSCHEWAIHLHKRIPHGAGLGGGSSDAAATLRAFNDILKLDLARASLRAMAAELGSDVPFFLVGGTALVEGRGELVTPLPDPPQRTYLLATPPLRISTASVFSRVTGAHWSDGHQSRELASDLESGATPHLAVNGLTPAVIEEHSIMNDYLLAVRRTSPSALTVSGSGSTIVATYVSETLAHRAALSLGSGWRCVHVVSSVRRSETHS